MDKTALLVAGEVVDIFIFKIWTMLYYMLVSAIKSFVWWNEVIIF